MGYFHRVPLKRGQKRVKNSCFRVVSCSPHVVVLWSHVQKQWFWWFSWFSGGFSSPAAFTRVFKAFLPSGGQKRVFLDPFSCSCPAVSCSCHVVVLLSHVVIPPKQWFSWFSGCFSSPAAFTRVFKALLPKGARKRCVLDPLSCSCPAVPCSCSVVVM